MRRTQAGSRRTLVLLAVAGVVVFISVWATASALRGSHKAKVVHLVIRDPTPKRPAAHKPHPPKRPRHPATGRTHGSYSPPATSQAQGVLRPGAAASFARLVAGFPGPVGLALAPVQASHVQTLGDDEPAHGWSTTKVPVLSALLVARGGAGLTPAEQQEATLAITQSDNQSILDLFGDLESIRGGLVPASGAVQHLLRESGDGRTIVATAPPPPGGVTTFGQTAWAPGESVKFDQMLARGCLLPTKDTNYVLDLMQRIVPSESWGLGSGGFGVPVAFKGGWGPEPSGYLVRQSGIIDVGSPQAVAVSIVAYPSAGSSFDAGTQTLTATARWLSRELVLRPEPGATCS